MFGQEALHALETEVETFPILSARKGNRTEDVNQWLKDIDALEESRMDALDWMKLVQALRKEVFDRKLPTETGIVEGSLVLQFDNRHRDFLGKLHTWWMEPFRLCKVYSKGSLQLGDLEGNPHDTRVNGSRVKLYRPEGLCEDAHV